MERGRAGKVGTAVRFVTVLVKVWVTVATVLAWVGRMGEDMYRAEVGLERGLYRAEVEKAGQWEAEVEKVTLGGPPRLGRAGAAGCSTVGNWGGVGSVGSPGAPSQGWTAVWACTGIGSSTGGGGGGGDAGHRVRAGGILLRGLVATWKPREANLDGLKPSESG